MLLSQKSLGHSFGHTEQAVAKWEKSGKIPKAVEYFLRSMYLAKNNGNTKKSFFIENKKSFLIATGIYIHSVAIFYTTYFFYPGYLEEHGLIASGTVNEVRVIMVIFFLVLFLILGKYLNRDIKTRTQYLPQPIRNMPRS